MHGGDSGPKPEDEIGTPALFDVAADRVEPRRFSLEAVERLDGDLVRLRYRVEGVRA